MLVVDNDGVLNKKRPLSIHDGLFHRLLNPVTDQYQSGVKSIIKMLICITVYNETWEELKETLEGVYTNLNNFS